MAAKPPISVRRPHRSVADPPREAPVQISHAPVPDVDPEAPEALAFAMRGRMSAGVSNREGEGPAGPKFPSSSPELSARAPNQPEQISAEHGVERQPTTGSWHGAVAPSHPSGGTLADEAPLISVKLPTEIGRRLAAVADRRGSKRTMVAIEVLSAPLRQLAAEHRAGLFPELPRVISGTVRSSIAFALPADLAADLEFVLRQRRAVRAQVVTRLLVPAIEHVYATEIGEGGH